MERITALFLIFVLLWGLQGLTLAGDSKYGDVSKNALDNSVSNTAGGESFAKTLTAKAGALDAGWVANKDVRDAFYRANDFATLKEYHPNTLICYDRRYKKLKKILGKNMKKLDMDAVRILCTPPNALFGHTIVGGFMGQVEVTKVNGLIYVGLLVKTDGRKIDFTRFGATGTFRAGNIYGFGLPVKNLVELAKQASVINVQTSRKIWPS